MAGGQFGHVTIWGGVRRSGGQAAIWPDVGHVGAGDGPIEPREDCAPCPLRPYLRQKGRAPMKVKWQPTATQRAACKAACPTRYPTCDIARDARWLYACVVARRTAERLGLEWRFPELAAGWQHRRHRRHHQGREYSLTERACPDEATPA